MRLRHRSELLLELDDGSSEGSWIKGSIGSSEFCFDVTRDMGMDQESLIGCLG